jgi:hypothetical protein
MEFYIGSRKLLFDWFACANVLPGNLGSVQLLIY